MGVVTKAKFHNYQSNTLLKQEKEEEARSECQGFLKGTGIGPGHLQPVHQPRTEKDRPLAVSG